MQRACIVSAFLLFTAATSWALPPGADPAFRDGANHHAGDDSFVVRFGRAPDARDSEELRMHTHLVFVRERLGAMPATEPALAARRAELLGYLDDYIAKGTTPVNTYLPWRSPVFIDASGNVCAVGYLIERSVGRDLAERIAREQRFAFLEDIAAAMPDVRAWIASSGLTLDELASIQPAYSEPEIQTWKTWDLAKNRPEDGPYQQHFMTGAFANGRMTGPWTIKTDGGEVLGAGTLVRGAGDWASFYSDGTRRGEGRYVRNRAQGPWKVYHRSGNLAAEGRFDTGVRVGKWRFYYDTPAKTPIAIGKFTETGWATGTWKHFDASGTLLARSWEETPAQWNDDDILVDGGDGFTIDVVAKDGLVQRAHTGTPHSHPMTLTMLELGGEQIYLHEAFYSTTIYDAGGHLLSRAKDGAWSAATCHWSSKRKAIAKSGDVARMHGLLMQDARRWHGPIVQFGDEARENAKPACDRSETIGIVRAKRLDALVVARSKVRAPAPAFVTDALERRPMFAEPDPDADDDVDDVDVDDTDHDVFAFLSTDEPDYGVWERDREMAKRDLARQIVHGTTMYAEWAHIDGVFVGLFHTIPGRYRHHWASGPDPELP